MSQKPSARVEKIPAQRQASILEILREQGAVSIQMLSDQLGASFSTVRRDLDHLTEKGYIERHHGGAVIRREPAARFEPEASIAAETCKAQKDAIGALAATRVSDGQSVIFDSSSTVTAVARHLVERGTAITAVTNDLKTALTLTMSPRIQMILSGGTVTPGGRTLIGRPGEAFLSDIHADIAFIGVHSVSGSIFTETSLETAAMKQRMIAAARKVIVVADFSKFGPSSFCTICPVAAVDELITDRGTGNDRIAEIERAGTLCSVAPPLGPS